MPTARQYRLYNPAKDRIIFSAAPRFVEEERLDLPDDTLGDDSGTVVFNPMEADFPEELTSSTINHKDRRTRAPVGGAGDAGNDILGNDSGSHVILRWIPGAIRCNPELAARAVPPSIPQALYLTGKRQRPNSHQNDDDSATTVVITLLNVTPKE